MSKKSRDSSGDSIMRQLDAENVEHLMLFVLTKDGDRVYTHPFENDIAALEFMEGMTIGFRNDLIEKALKRMIN